MPPTEFMQLFLRKVRVALTPRHWLLKTRLANGGVVFGQNRPGYGGRGIYVFREALEPEFEHLEKFLSPGGVFLDIGGNTGAYTVKAAQFFRGHGGGTVVTYEPLPEMLAALNHNLAANGFDNVRLRSFCLGAQPCAAEFWLNFNRPASSSLASRDPRAARRSVLVLRLDDVFPLEQLGRLDYVKIDVEGAEAQVLAGANETFKTFRPIIQLETGIADVRLDLAEYSAWQSPGGPNKLCIPNENPKVGTAGQLGWRKIC
jgi:FkbM family methyltransferase